MWTFPVRAPSLSYSGKETFGVRFTVSIYRSETTIRMVGKFGCKATPNSTEQNNNHYDNGGDNEKETILLMHH